MINKADLYLDAINRKCECSKFTGNHRSKELYKHIAFLGVKFILASYCKDADYKAMMQRFTMTEYVKGCMSMLTPKEFMQLFPITKTYNGAKNECKDYFSTMEFIHTLEQDEPIGDRKALESFLWGYWNWDINLFVAETYSLLTNLMNMRGKAGPLDKVMEDMPTFEIDDIHDVNLTHLRVVK